mmetsp:Transcript_27406/g.63399  ORF Transcript_27406/g.63399 Transcript_27406/m.63399 type:complete len:273 (-) Transcript_27406:112-930(-)
MVVIGRVIRCFFAQILRRLKGAAKLFETGRIQQVECCPDGIVVVVVVVVVIIARQSQFVVRNGRDPDVRKIVLRRGELSNLRPIALVRDNGQGNAPMHGRGQGQARQPQGLGFLKIAMALAGKGGQVEQYRKGFQGCRFAECCRGGDGHDASLVIIVLVAGHGGTIELGWRHALHHDSMLSIAFYVPGDGHHGPPEYQRYHGDNQNNGAKSCGQRRGDGCRRCRRRRGMMMMLLLYGELPPQPPEPSQTATLPYDGGGCSTQRCSPIGFLVG